MHEQRESRPVGGAAFRRAGQALNTDTTPTAPAEASAWLRDAIARRVRELDKRLAGRSDLGIVVAPLGAPTSAGSVEDRRCDRCRVIVALGLPFHVWALEPRPKLRLIVGMCAHCHDRERAS